MERRKEPRVYVQQDVILTVLGDPDERPFGAVAVDMSGSGIGILSPKPVPYGAAVKLESSELLLLGEVIRSEASGESYLLAVHLLHSLSALGDLRRLSQALRWEAGQGEPAVPAVVVVRR